MTIEEKIKYGAQMSRVALLHMGMSRQTCVASVKLTTEVLRGVGILVRPFAASLLVVTPGWEKRMQAGDPIPKSAEEWERWWDEHKAYSVGCLYDPNPSPGAWNAHAILVANREYLVDPSFDQFSRPQYELAIDGPAIVPMLDRDSDGRYEKFVKGETQAVCTYADEETGARFTAVWSVFPSDTTLKKLPDWVEFEARYGPTCASIVETIRQMDDEGLTGDALPPLPSLPEAWDNPDLKAKPREVRKPGLAWTHDQLSASSQTSSP